jgi:hypothetical protein
MADNGLRIKEFAEGNLGKFLISLLSAVRRSAILQYPFIQQDQIHLCREAGTSEYGEWLILIL